MKKIFSLTLILASFLLSSCADLMDKAKLLQAVIGTESIGVGSVSFSSSAYHDPKLGLAKADSILSAFGTSSDQIMASQLKKYYPNVAKLTNSSPASLVKNSLNGALRQDSFFSSRYSDNPQTKINIEITSLGFNRENDKDSVLDMELGLGGNVSLVNASGETLYTFTDINGSSKLSTLIQAISASNIDDFRGQAASAFAESIKNSLRSKF